MSRLEQRGKGILLLHDIHPWTAAAVPELLKQLKEKGWARRTGRAVGARRSRVLPWWPPRPERSGSLQPIAEPSVVDLGSAPHAWPKPDLVTPDDIVMPVPDAAAFALNEPLQQGSRTTEQAGTPRRLAGFVRRQTALPSCQIARAGVAGHWINMKGQKLVGADWAAPKPGRFTAARAGTAAPGTLAPAPVAARTARREGHRAKLGSPRPKLASLLKPGTKRRRSILSFWKTARMKHYLDETAISLAITENGTGQAERSLALPVCRSRL